ncbi:hypothetical protein HMPREF1981_01992 [Bacteroides pyogenes F0041]|uniref:Uncharacterized protein n=1 Tax=Bacteroides pyogenes F0041 TaxID=1321819 RepID=U2CKN1_9BACE|nr:hypothetical protein HMPREF1981_01992 [Bacteroides pyogenes F0041]
MTFACIFGFFGVFPTKTVLLILFFAPELVKTYDVYHIVFVARSSLREMLFYTR